MKRMLIFIILTVLATLNLSSKTPYCRVRHYDEHSGLSLRSVKQIVQDGYGYIWLATWNGLNRFDGMEFVKVKPKPDDDVHVYSDRIGDIKLTSGGNLLCRVDDRLLMFDTSTYRFHDYTAMLETKFDTTVPVARIHRTTTDETLLTLSDGRYVLMADADPEGTAVLLDTLPDRRMAGGGNHRIKEIPGYPNSQLLYSGQDSNGIIWLITRSGEILWAPERGMAPRLLDKIDSNGEMLYFSTIDREENIWLRCTMGAYCVSLGELPYDPLPGEGKSQIRASFKDERGIWTGDIATKSVAIHDPAFRSVRYLTPRGELTEQFAEFGARVYAIGKDNHGNIWLGTKPDGLYRLRPAGNDRFDINHFTPGNSGLPLGDIYDLASDGDGQLWIATLGAGVTVIPDPGADKPEFLNLGHDDAYPKGASAVRSLEIVGDSLLIAATRGGLLVADITRGPDRMAWQLHVSDPGRETSLGNIATMSIVSDFNGHTYVATESDGVNMLESPLQSGDRKFEFRRFNEASGVPSDVAISLMPDKKNQTMWVISNGKIYSLDPATGMSRAYSATFWNNKLRFSEGRPLHLDDNRWLVGVESGAIILDLDGMREYSRPIPVVYTSYSIQNRNPVLVTGNPEPVVLSADERNITVNFAALEYQNSSDLRYSFRIDGGDWNNLGKSRSVSFLDLDPGEYTLEVRSSDSTGRWLDNEASMKIIVKPRFHETLFAKILFLLIALAAAAGITWLVLYIRRINARQRETLAAYLKLLEPQKDNTGHDIAEQRPNTPPVQAVALGSEDEEFMARVMDFVNTHIGDSETGVDEMADHVAVSRSVLTRRMKSLLGVTPSEFLKDSRLRHAATLISTTDMALKDIAIDCGFSDLNYFGKCFKSVYGMTPSAFRKEKK